MSRPELEALQAEYRDAVESLSRLRGSGEQTQRADEIAALEARLEALESALRLNGAPVPPRLGPWSPLPMFETERERPDAADDAPVAEEEATEDTLASFDVAEAVRRLYDLPRSSKAARRRVRLAARELTRRPRLSLEDTRLLAVALEEVQYGALADELRGRHPSLTRPAVVHEQRVVLSSHAPFAPSPHDGLTEAQRLVLGALKTGPGRVGELCGEDRPPELDETTVLQAVAELLLPRPFPLVASRGVGADRLLTATRVARSLPFFPNALVNGCAAPLAYPVFPARRVFEAARQLLVIPGARADHLAMVLGQPLAFPGPIVGLAQVAAAGAGTLDVIAHVSFDFSRLIISGLIDFEGAPSLSARVLRVAQAAEGVHAVERHGNDLHIVLRHVAYRSVLLARLEAANALRLHFEVAWRAPFGLVPLRSMFDEWLGACRDALLERQGSEKKVVQRRLGLVIELLRAAEHEAAIFRLVDESLSRAEAVVRLQREWRSADDRPQAGFSLEAAIEIAKSKSLTRPRERLEAERRDLESQRGITDVGPALRDELSRVEAELLPPPAPGEREQRDDPHRVDR